MLLQFIQTAQFLQNQCKEGDDTPYILYNHDLAGFFTSVDEDRFLAADHLMASGHQDKNWTHAPTFNIDHTQKDPKHRVHQGKGRQNNMKMPPAINTASTSKASPT